MLTTSWVSKYFRHSELESVRLVVANDCSSCRVTSDATVVDDVSEDVRPGSCGTFAVILTNVVYERVYT